ncbi:platelet-activating factor acetylhydrolase [Frankliniella occidentalis]|uniref:1-alkyl-2-acetylglycerophosphocholine esterase n=1 Tax=Frankliniella occidentalis TaxID=133901 RepID=A0A6J1S721_FRAOC|nr:platelet-activating factor acetylhydrolase [Frankliniella occidentalis]
MFWERKACTLPKPEGPYIPGCIDVMTEYSPEGCFFRLFYPSSLEKTVEEKWVPWIDHPIYARGFAFILGVYYFVLRLYVWLVSGTPYIPAVWAAPLCKQKEKFPVVVFSHGLGACKFFYSGTYTELASQGFVVAALEHRDTSACATYYYASPQDHLQSKKTWIKHHKMGFGLENFPARVKQVRQRAVECSRTLDLLEHINAGQNIKNLATDNFPLDAFKGQLNFEKAVMMGHSFGGASALLTLYKDHRFKYGVILDSWMYTLKDEPDMPGSIKQPLIFINTETFHIDSNITTMQKFIDHPQDAERHLYTIRMTTHENQTDTVHIVGYWLDWFMKKIDPVLASRLNHALILRFLNQHIGLTHSCNFGILESQSQFITKDFIRRNVKPRRS